MRGQERLLRRYICYINLWQIKSHFILGSAVGHSCPIEGQVFQTCRTCPATCSNPDRICTLACEQGCGCPSGQFIDQVNRRCVSLEDCPSCGYFH